MRKLILAAAAAIAFSSPVLAQPACVPLPVIGAEMRAAGITAENFLTTTEPTEISLYHKSLGIEIPDGVEPVGMLVVVLQDRAIVGLVQDEGGACIRYAMTITLEKHRIALAAATTGA